MKVHGAESSSEEMQRFNGVAEFGNPPRMTRRIEKRFTAGIEYNNGCARNFCREKNEKYETSR